MRERILFLSWEAPWPAHSGAALRTLGLVRELAKAYELEIVVLSRRPLSKEQSAKLGEYAKTVSRVSLKDATSRDKLGALAQMIMKGLPYHSGVLVSSFQDHRDVRKRIEDCRGIVFTSTGHWGTICRNRPGPNWILNQCDADVELWRVYASQTNRPLVKAIALINGRLAKRLYRRIYSRVGRIISVCEDDLRLTRRLAPKALIDIVENGIDCAYYAPKKEPRAGRPPRLLLTGTSAARNMTALRWFVYDVLPLITKALPTAEFLVAGNFRPEAQALFQGIPAIRFTGRVDDIRPYFNRSDVYVAPFQYVHGSKLKIAEAMAMAMAIVSTPEGIRGLSLKDGESVLIGENAAAFADNCLRLLRDDEMRARLEDAARRLAVASLDWSILGERLRSIIEDHRSRLTDR
jgi:glycosyltransferase involved in cell wall biosynthesis